MTEGDHRGSLGASDSVIRLVEELQFTLGEGPCIDACLFNRPVFVPDLRAADPNRWPAFTSAAIDAGVGALFGFPLPSADSNLGALSLYTDRPGTLQPIQVVDAARLAGVISRTVLGLQADAPVGTLAHELETVLDHRAVVHQASGMVSAQLEIAVDDALVRIRARSYIESRPVNDVALDIVDCRIRLD